MTLTNIAVNKNNVISIIKKPVEIVCIQVKKIYSRCRSQGVITLRWDYSTDAPLQELISCRVREVQVKECRLFPLIFSNKVSVEVCYLVKVDIVYRDSVGKIGMAFFDKELHRRSRPLPGTPAMNGMADVSLELLDCHVESAPQRLTV